MAKMKWGKMTKAEQRKHIQNMTEKAAIARKKRKDLTRLAQGATMEPPVEREPAEAKYTFPS